MSWFEDFTNFAEDLFVFAWELPNNIIGVALGTVGEVIGWTEYELGLTDTAPSWEITDGKVEFYDNPLMALGSITLGQVQIFGDDGASTQAHEDAHVPQSELLGPLYLPSNIIGGIIAEVVDGDWHGPSNWNEVGPQQTPPVPWP